MDELNKMDFLEDFRSECKEHLSNLNQLLLELEKTPTQTGIIESLGREFHTLKAAARLMGFEKIEKIVHKLEDLFGAIYNKKLAFNSKINDIALNTLDRIEESVRILPLENPDIDLEKMEQYIDLAKEGRVENIVFKREKQEPDKAEEKKILPVPEPQIPQEKAQPNKPSPDVSLEKPKEVSSNTLLDIDSPDSIRIRTEKLDQLFNLIGELVMFRLRSQETENQLLKLCNMIQNFKDDWEHTRNSKTDEEQSLNKVREKLSHIEKVCSSILYHSNANAALLNNVSEGLRDRIMQLRMLPLNHLFQSMPRALRDIAREEGKDAALIMEGEDIEIDRKILEQMKDPMLHLIRNAISHGIELPQERIAINKEAKGIINIKSRRQGNQIWIEISDDGRGIDSKRVKEKALELGIITEQEAQNFTEKDMLQLIFRPGFSTRDKACTISGRGVGLDIVKTAVHNQKGSVDVASEPGKGTSFTIRLPLSLATSHVLLVRLGEEIYAVPLDSIQEIVLFKAEIIEKIENRDCIYLRDRTIPVVDLAAVLERPFRCSESKRQTALVVSTSDSQQSIAFIVDEILGEQEIVAKSLGNQIRRLPYIQGASILGKGEVILILNIASLVHYSRSAQNQSQLQKVEKKIVEKKKRKVLVVDDSVTTRKLEQAILEAAGYQVDVAVHGKDALHKLKSSIWDIVVTDIQMPIMDGFELTKSIRENTEWKKMPIIVVSALDKEEHKKLAFNNGAQGYITKGQFNQENLISMIENLCA